METTSLVIDGKKVSVPFNYTILQAARKADIYIPGLCDHPDLPPFKGQMPEEKIYQGKMKKNNQINKEHTGCGLCVVEIKGEKKPLLSCVTMVKENMVVTTNSPELKALRQKRLVPILENHPHACLTCAQAQGCSRSQCSSNVAEEERCCPKFGDCELGKVVEYIGILPTTPRYKPLNLPIVVDEPLFIKNYNLCIGCTRCVRACDDLRGIGALGFIFDEKGRIQVGAKTPDITESYCRFCGACVEVCPTGAILDKVPYKNTQAIAPCQSACPAQIDVPLYLNLTAQGKTDQALAVIKEKVPFPGVLGRVCVHFCEQACQRNLFSEPLSICLIKRFCADYGKTNTKISKAPPSGKKVGILGSGPAGLTTGYYLALKGHEVTIFEALDEPGGMMRYGICAFRLPRDVLDKEIDEIIKQGVTIKNKTRIKDLKELENLGFDAIFLGTGASLSSSLDIPGFTSNRVLPGLDFLQSVAKGNDPQLGPKVLVIGGGNVAIDVALTALRQNAQKVDLICLEKKHEMPAHDWEIKGAEEEGVVIHNCWGPVAIHDQGRTTFKRCLEVFDSTKKFNPIFDESETIDFEADHIILAIGQKPDLSFLENDSQLKIKQGLLAIDSETCATDKKGIFAGGDMALRPGTVIQAIAQGRKAASSVDLYLGGDGKIDWKLWTKEKTDSKLPKIKAFMDQARVQPLTRPAWERKLDYKESIAGYTQIQAQNEASRCLQCQLRFEIETPTSPPKNFLKFEQTNLDQVPHHEGLYILYNQEEEILVIKGSMDLKDDLENRLQGGSKACYFQYHEEPLFSKAESEAISAYLQKHGTMPPGDGGDSGDDLEDLF